MPKYEAGSIEWVLDVLDQNANKTLDLFNKRIDILEKKLISTDKQVETTKKGFFDFSKVIKQAGVVLASAFTFGTFVSGIRAALNGAREFETTMASVSTLIAGESSKAISGFSKEISQLSKTIPKTANDLGVGLYQTLSAGITDSADAMQFLEVASKAATAGLTTTNTAVDAISTVVNAYGLEASEATMISDIFFATVREGKTTFDQMAVSVGRVASSASLAGVSFAEIGASLATMTKAGIQTEEAVNALNNLLLRVAAPTDQIKEATEAIGIEFSASALKAQGFQTFMENLTTALEENQDVIFELGLDMQSFKALSILAGTGADEFAKQLNNMENSAGAAEEAFAKMNDTFDAQYQILVNQLQDALRAIADPAIREATEQINELNKSVGASGENINALTQILGNAGEALVKIFGGGLNLTIDILQSFVGLTESAVLHIAKLDDAIQVMGFNIPFVSKKLDAFASGIERSRLEAAELQARAKGFQGPLLSEVDESNLPQYGPSLDILTKATEENTKATNDNTDSRDDNSTSTGGASAASDALKDSVSSLNDEIKKEESTLEKVQNRLQDYNRETADLDFTNQQTFERIMDMLEDTGLSLEDFGFTYDTVIEDVRSALDTLESEHESAASKIGKEIDGIIDDIAKLREAFTEEEATAETGFIEDAAKLVIEAEEKKKELAQDLVKLFVETPTEQLKSFDFTTRKKEIEDAIAEQEAIIARSGQLQVDIEGEVTKQRELADMDALSRLEFLYNEEKTKREAAFQEELTQLETRKMELESQLQEETTLYETQKAELTAIEEGFTDTYIANLQTRESATITSIQTLIQAYNELAAAAQAAGVGGVTTTAEAPAPVGAGFAQGGFTGAGNPSQVAGVVHKGEYVAPARQVAAMPAVFKALDGLRGQPNTANTAPVDNSRKFEFNIENHGKEAADFYSQIDRIKWYMRYSA